MFDWQQKLRNPDFPFFTFLWSPFTQGAPCDIPCGTGDILHFGWSPMPAAWLPSACVLGANPSYCQVLFTCQPVPLGHLFSQLPVSLRLHVSTSSPKFGWNQPPSSSAVWLPFPFSFPLQNGQTMQLHKFYLLWKQNWEWQSVQSGL